MSLIAGLSLPTHKIFKLDFMSFQHAFLDDLDFFLDKIYLSWFIIQITAFKDSLFNYKYFKTFQGNYSLYKFLNYT